MAVADDETTPVVTLSLSLAEVVEGEGLTSVTATLDNRSSVETTVIVSASPAEFAAFSEGDGQNTLIIPAGQTTSSGRPVEIRAVDDGVLTGAEKRVTVSGAATNPQGVAGPEAVTLTILDDERPIFSEDSIAYTFTAGVVASRFLPEAAHGNGTQTYSISPAPDNGVTFIPGPPARIGVSATSAAADEMSYTLTATDADGGTDTMTVTVTVRSPVCPGSAAASGAAAGGLVSDCEALLSARDTLEGGASLNWSADVSIAEWDGVEVERRTKRVVGLELDYSNQLRGTIPSELGSLTNLRWLNLENSQLSGAIPPELGSLTNLEHLALWSNELTGEIPAELGSLTNLQSLGLGGNRLTGEIPAELGRLSNLEGLYLANTELSGPIPAELGSLVNLQWLELQSNRLTGRIPAELGGLVNLRSLQLHRNQLTGPIPVSLGGLTNLEELYLRGNRLTGCIPDALRNVGDDDPDNDPDHDLDRLGLPFCGEHACVTGGAVTDAGNPELVSDCNTLLSARDTLAGTAALNWSADRPISEWDGVEVEGAPQRVTELHLQDSELSGEIPAELGSLSSLEVLTLSGNQLSGEIPASLSGLTNLKELYLSDNLLTGCIPDGLRRVRESDLSDLGLPFCGDLACVVDGAVGDATNAGLALDCEALLTVRDALAGAASLNWSADRPISKWDGVEVEGAPRRVTALHLEDNELSGTIPPELGSLTKLRRLYLYRNELTGPVPPELGSLASLQSLSLSSNQLTGEIPTELGNLSNLQSLNLSSNQLEGEIPTELGKLSNLSSLEIITNQLTGEIPTEWGKLSNLRRLLLWDNRLTGEIPTELGELTNLRGLSLSSNQLTGEIPAELGKLSNLTELYLSSNQLRGEIPAQLSSLNNLRQLDLDRNQLTGEIPEELGDLANLERLSLNDNRLTGPIPAELGSLTNLQRLFLRNNRLTGCIPTDLRDVADDRSDNDPDHDLDQLGLPYCDVVLSGLSVSPRTLTPPFEPYHADYDALEGPSLVTVAATVGSSAIVRVLDPGGAPLTDAYGSQAGHQVDLGTGIAGIRITVTSQDGRASNTYTIRVRPVSACVARGAVTDATNSGLLSDCETLLAARDTLAGEATLDWSAGRPITEWDGVRVDGTPERVTELRLGDNDLSGTIPPELGGLTNLRWLRLNGNELTGAVPPELGGLTNLQGLSLRDNRLTGTLPQGLTGLGRLWSFDFYNNPGLCAPVDDAFQAWLQGISNLRGSSCAPEDSAEDRTVLASLYRAAGGTSWGRNANWLSDLPIRDWHGVTADADGRVTGLHFWGNRLSGPQALDLLGSLANLEVLELGRNRLSGQIPASLGGLTELEGLSLSGNQITGPIPPELGGLSSLESLYLRENRLTGPIPPELGGLSSLHTLSLEHNQLTGPIPASLGSLSNLRSLRLNDNRLTGQIPSSLGSLSNLRSLQLNDNRLTGQIPSELGGLSRLWWIALAGNRLTGCVPQELRDVWSNDFEELGLPFCDAMGSPGDRDALVALYNATDGENWADSTKWLSDEPMGEWYGVTTDEEGRVSGLSLTENQLSGGIPAGLGSLSSLQSLDLGGNRLTGEIPTELGKLSNLESLFLNYNELTGEIPADLGGLSNLTQMDLGANRLNGEIPRELGNLSSMTHLYFGTNQLTGRIPPELGKLSNLRDLALNSSRLTGEIPSELGNLSNLEKLYLHENRLTGEIPEQLGRLSRLTRLHLENNRLAGELPKSLTVLTMLERLLFNDNAGLCAPTDEAFQAWLQTIGSVSGRNCGVADSQEDRAVLVELYNATDGANWTDNTNWLSEEPLDTWYGVRTGGDGRVTGLELSNNGLKGDIPDEVGTLTRLEVLNLGYNEMTGPLSAWVGDLRHLRRLHLAGNVFHGELPAELGSLPRLEVLTLSGSAGFFGKLPEALTKANKLRRLTFHGTALCAPLDEGFREWLDGLSEWRGSDCPPESKDLPISAEAQYPITMRELGYGYTIDIPDDWRENELSIREFDLPAETTLAQFAEFVRDDLERKFSASAFVFEITSFEKKDSTDQGSYIIEYRLREDPDHCMKNTVEQIALGSSLPGPARGYRLKHEVCDWRPSTELDRVRRETLASFRIVTNPDAYYHQFISRPGVTIKAPDRVDPEALQESAEILDVMLDGRQDIPDCLGRIGSALAIIADGDPLTALPEFSFLRDEEGEWGRYYNSTHAPGAGGGEDSPVSATPEQMLRGPAGYPPFRDVHEPGHHVQICFTESDNLQWVDLYWDAVERVGSVDEYDPISELVSSSNHEFWAGFSSFYFFVHYAPRRYARQLFPEAFAFVESIYGKLTPTESDHPGYVQYVTASGHALPWLVPGGDYENDAFGYRMELLPGWVVKKESAHELLLVSRNWPWPTIRVHYTRLSDRLNPDDALVSLAESRRLDWQQRTRGWHRSEVKSFERGSLDGNDTYWIHFYGQERPGDCEVDVIERVLLATHGGDNYGVVLEGSACGEGNDYAIQDFETMLRSFILPTSIREPTPGPTPTPTPETDSSELAGLERDALVALYNSTGGERWYNNENWLSDKPVDTWYGVRTVGGRVIKLFLDTNRLRGQIPAELGNLTHLRLC